MAGETEQKADEKQARQGLTRREAMLQLLRVGGVAAGAAGAGCLAQRAQLPSGSGAG